MSQTNDFIIENGVLKKYIGNKIDVIVPEGVTTLGRRAFFNCSISHITLPDSLEIIDDEAFKSCRGFNEIIIPASVRSMGRDSFMFGFSLKRVIFSEGMTEIGDGAFSCCFQLEEVNVPDSVTRIGAKAFYGCPALTSLTLGNGVTEIGEYAFTSCKVMNLTLPATLINVSDMAFSGCTTLRTVTLPRGVEVFEGSVLEVIWRAFMASRLEVVICSAMMTQYPHLVEKSDMLINQARRTRIDIIESAFLHSDYLLLSAVLSLLGAESLNEIDDMLLRCRGSIEMTALLLDYKNKHYTTEEIEDFEAKKIEDELGTCE